MQGQDPRIIEVLRPVAQDLGCELLGMEIVGGDRLLRLYIDSGQGVGVDDCAGFTERAAVVLQAERLIRHDWSLEVSSPGLDRILFTPEQMARWVGSEVRIRLVRKWQERRRLVGRLLAVDSSSAEIEQNGERFKLPCSVIEQMRLQPDWDAELRDRG